jgi:hypothetical protein
MGIGIPTMYRGTQFRSRLEARWAAFFDEVGWSWKYEPIDLAGYIPDFILDFFEPMLVEVKPILGLDALDDDNPLAAEALEKIKRSEWKGSFLLVGVQPFEAKASWPFSSIIGMDGNYHDASPDGDNWGYGWGRLLVCPRCDCIAWDAWYGPLCRRCGAWKSDLVWGVHRTAERWARAQNRTQWRGTKDSA